MRRWVYKLYNGLVLVSLPFIVLGVMLRWRKRFARGVERWPERWGRLTLEQSARLSSGPWWWVHAVSLGEVKAIEVFLREAPTKAGVKIFLTLVTPEALAWATERNIAAMVTAAPVDLPWVVRRVFRVVQPKLLISVESEFWPNLLREARRSGARVALINGRISAHSYRSYLRFRSWLPALWENFDLVAVRQHEDASRFADLGIPQRKIHVTGNLKYDLPLPVPLPASSAASLKGPVLVIGSSRHGEERELLPVMTSLGARFSNLQIIWAPRHLERIQEIENLFIAQGLHPIRKTQQGVSGPCVLWDTMGELLDAYRMADIAVIGGSFVPKGGQNPIEPAALGVPVVFGPSMENFHGIAEVLVQQGGGAQVTLTELERCLADLLENAAKRQKMGQQARLAVMSRQGATRKTLALLKDLSHA